MLSWGMSFGRVTLRYLGFGETRFALAVFAAAVAAALIEAPLDAWGALAAALGVCLWLGIEYPIHRYVLHLKPPRAPALRAMHRRLHTAHHADPDDPSLLFLPLWVTAPSAVLVYAVATFAAGGRGAQFFAGFWGTLLVYEWLHLAIHLRYAGSGRLYGLMRKGHMLHHYKNEHYWFGIMNPGSDFVFGTHPAPGDVPTSATTKTLAP